MNFEETYIGKIRGGLGFEKIFSYSALIGPILDEEILPYLKEHFGNIEDIESDKETILIKAKENKFRFSIDDSIVSHSYNAMPVADIRSYIEKINYLYDILIGGLKISKKIEMLGLEFTYVIPFLKGKAFEVIDNIYFHGKTKIFMLDEDNTPLKTTVELLSKITEEKLLNVKMETNYDNTALIFTVDNRFSLGKETDIGYKELQEESYDAFLNKICKRLIAPALASKDVDIKMLQEGEADRQKGGNK